MKSNKKEKNKNEFLKMLTVLDRDQLQEFIKDKGRKPKMIKPFICLNSRISNQ